MLSCKEIVKQASKNIDAELIWHERMGLKIHLMMCKSCSRYAKQLKFIQQAVFDLNEQNQTNKNIQLSTEAKGKISQALSQLKV